ncbi:MAG: hypothetical protein ACE145_19750 [Terriglobia bacterium]
MDLIDRYVHQVGEHLPAEMRADVEAELRSLLLDMVEERARATGKAAERDLVTRVLREFGSPEEVAARYAPPSQHLIGPRLFPIYRKAVGIICLVFAALLVAFFVAGVVKSLQKPEEAVTLGTALGALAKLFHAAIYNFGLLTLVFAIVERVQRRRELTGKMWNPAKLPPVEDPERISAAGHVFSLYAILLFAVVFNFFPDWVAIFGFAPKTGAWRLPMLRPEFSNYLPILNIWWALAFTLNLVVLRQGRWRRETRWAEFALGLLAIGIMLMVILGPPVFRYDRIVKIVLSIALVGKGIETSGRLFRLLRHPAAAPWNAGESEAPERQRS